jgi:hypothetical protein
MLRRPRIVASAFFATAAVAVCVLWFRSYWTEDTWGRSYLKKDNSSPRLDVDSELGAINLSYCPDCFPFSPTWEWNSMPAQPVHGRPSWLFNTSAGLEVRFPCSLPVTIFTLLAVAPWIRWHFNLRTMFVATTVAAIALAMIVALSR